MAIVRGLDGRFFDIDDETLNSHEVKPEDLPADARARVSGPRPSAPPPWSGTPPAIQIIVQAARPSQPPPRTTPPGAAAPSEVMWADMWHNWQDWTNHMDLWQNT